jgi:hypothetical protein
VGALASELARPEFNPRPPCVVDARLALGPYGLRVVASLTRVFEVWLPQTLRDVLREARRYVGAAGALVPRLATPALRGFDAEAEAAAVASELRLWERMPEEPELSALPIHFLGARSDECFTPAGSGPGLRERCEQLQRGLDLLLRRSDWDRGRHEEVSGCTRDGLALGAALAASGAFLLTRLERDGGPPALLDYLDAWGLCAREAKERGGRIGAVLGGLIARAGLSPLAWDGVRLAAVHVLLPGLPVIGRGDARLDDAAVARQWQMSSLYWYEVC